MNNSINNMFQMNQMGMNMMGNINNNQNLINNMYQMQNKINPLMNINNNFLNQMNNNQFNPNNIQMPQNYINPYQRIIELENIIKQKDLKIEDLKRQLQNKVKFNDLSTILCDNKTIDIQFKFIPLENPKNEFEFQETCYIHEKFIMVKKRISKKLNKN